MRLAGAVLRIPGALHANAVIEVTETRKPTTGNDVVKKLWKKADGTYYEDSTGLKVATWTAATGAWTLAATATLGLIKVRLLPAVCSVLVCSVRKVPATAVDWLTGCACGQTNACLEPLDRSPVAPAVPCHSSHTCR